MGNNAHGMQEQEETYSLPSGNLVVLLGKTKIFYNTRNKSEGNISRIIKYHYVVVNKCHVRSTGRT